MGHHHHDHHHASHHSAPYRVLILAIGLILGFAVIEFFGGLWANSLALLGDAGHMASDAIALAIAAFAAWVSQKPPSHKHSYGLGRAEIVAAWLSSLLMIVISLAVIIEAIHRINSPSHVKGGTVMVIAFIGMVINLLVAWLLARSERTLNIRAALLHVMSDVLGSLAALVSGAIIYFTGWYAIDPILSILIGVLIMISSLRLLKESLLVLMEGVPGHIDYKDVSAAMKNCQDIKDVHDLHIWTLSSGKIALSAHIDIHELSAWTDILKQINEILATKFAITHVTLQPEPDMIDCKPCQQ
jgi:cobalt-zinc-cadmium efflux system protein